MPPVLLPYQQRWIQDQSRVKIAEKSRRVGLSWADASDAALKAAERGGVDTWYVGYNKDMSEQYIEDVAFWARSFNTAVSQIEEIVYSKGSSKEVVINDEGQDILAFRVRFASGRKVTALSSRPSNLRAKKGRIVIDEAAFHDDLEQLLKAAKAILMWGGSVAIISTHNGVDNPFNVLCEETRRGENSHSLHKITLDDALADGLYQRICLTLGQRWSIEAEINWRSQLFRDYGIGADEELLCVPFAASSGKVFNRDWFTIVDSAPPGKECRGWDLAATEADLKGSDPCYTSGVKLRLSGGIIYVMDMIAEQLGPASTDDLILATARDDGHGCMQRWEQEGGSAGKRDAAHLAKMLIGFDAQGRRPSGDKVTRAKPLASQAKAGNVRLVRGDWNQRFLAWYHAFPDGKVKDPIDAGSLAFNELVGSGQRQQPTPTISASGFG